MAEDSPCYVEAYPQLNLFHGRLSRWNGGQVPFPIVRYHVPGRMPAGCVYVLSRTERHLVIDYWFPSLAYCQAEERTTLRLIEGPNGVDRSRQYLRCDECGKGVATLVFNGAWACRKCLGLRYRSQCVGTDVRLAEELAQLETRLGKHRPKHMHQARYDRERERAAWLRQQLGIYWPTVSAEYADVVQATWLRVDQVQESPHPKYEIVGGRMVPFLWEHEKPQPEPEPEPEPEKAMRMDPKAFE